MLNQHKPALMFELFFAKVNEKVTLTKEEEVLCTTFFIPKKLRKKQYLVQDGDHAKYLAFVEKGILRSYSVNDKGSEHILQFAFEGWWISDMYSFITGEPTAVNIDALEDCELLLLTKTAHDQMLERVPKLERFFRVLLQNNVIQGQRRMLSSLSHTAEEKYLQLTEACPSIPQRVPQHMMASFLGITPETLSRLRKQLSLRK